jgi:hypothetical protein
MNEFDEQTDFSFLGCSVEDSAKTAKTKKNYGTELVGVTLTRPGGMEGKTHTAEARAKISQARTGIKFSAEWCAKLSAALKGKPGNNLGRKMSDEQKAKLRAANLGKTISAETRAKMSAGNKGRVRSEEYKAKLSASNLGKTKSAETRAKISVSKIRPVMTPNGVYPSLAAVALAAGVSRAVTYDWKKKYPNDYYYIKDSK